MAINFDNEIKEATKDLKEVENKFNKRTKAEKKRVTTHIRISPHLKDRIRKEAKTTHRSASVLIDRIVTLYFKQNLRYEDVV